MSSLYWGDWGINIEAKTQLAVKKANYVARMYTNVGFEIIRKNDVKWHITLWYATFKEKSFISNEKSLIWLSCDYHRIQKL